MSALPRRADTTIPCPVCKVALRRLPLETGWIDDPDGLIETIVIRVEPHRCQKLEQQRRRAKARRDQKLQMGRSDVFGERFI